jgi:hypothetical protein
MGCTLLDLSPQHPAPENEKITSNHKEMFFTGSLMFVELFNLQHGSKSSRPKETC